MWVEVFSSTEVFLLLKSTSLFSQSQSCRFKGDCSCNVHLPLRIETTIRSGIEPTTTTASAEVILIPLLYVSFYPKFYSIDFGKSHYNFTRR